VGNLQWFGRGTSYLHAGHPWKLYHILKNNWEYKELGTEYVNQRVEKKRKSLFERGIGKARI
jgi:hypothetical protein